MTLISKNVTVTGRRTSMRLEQPSWDALTWISEREGMTVHRLVTEIDARRGAGSLTSAVSAFLVMYLHALAREAADTTEAMP